MSGYNTRAHMMRYQSAIQTFQGGVVLLQISMTQSSLEHKIQAGLCYQFKGARPTKDEKQSSFAATSVSPYKKHATTYSVFVVSQQCWLQL